MADYVISCCSTADLTHEHFVQRDIQYICFLLIVRGKNLSMKKRDIKSSGMAMNGNMS